MKNIIQHQYYRQFGLTAIFRIIPLAIFCAPLFGGCDNFTEVDTPPSQLTSSTVFEDKATANAAMTDIYSKIRDNGLLTGYNSGVSSQMGLYADELEYYGSPGGDATRFFSNSILPSGNEVKNYWNNSYSQIYAANSVVEGVAKSRALSSTDKDQLTGEALFVRAILHFYLVNLFSDIPYITVTDYQINKSVRRQPESEVYSLIKADLERASALLPEAYIGAERVRPNKWAAQALLARVNLYMGLWAEASNAASSVLNQTDIYVWPSGPDQVFVKESTAAIWQLMPGNGGDNTYEALSFIFVSGPPPATALSANLVNAFSAGDLRGMQWINGITDGVDTWYHANKYKQAGNTGSSMEYSIVLRTAEQYLIRAEARARQGNTVSAKDDLNMTRHLAGLPDTDAVTAEEIIDAVLLERRLELFTEFGHRFFDLKRTGKLDAVLGPSKPGWQSTDRLLPIPESELLLNPNLAPQNAGY